MRDPRSTSTTACGCGLRSVTVGTSQAVAPPVLLAGTFILPGLSGDDRGPERARRPPQCSLWIDSGGDRVGHHGEQPVADLVGLRRRRLEAAAAGAGDEFGRERQGRLRQGHAVDGGGAALLLDLLPLPRLVELLGRTRVRAGEDVRVAADQLLDEVTGHLVDAERLAGGPLLGDPGVEEHLEQQVSELLAQQGEIAGLDRFDDLVGLLEEVPRERLVRLRGVPRAAAGRPEAVHHLGGALQRRGHDFAVGQEPAPGPACAVTNDGRTGSLPRVKDLGSQVPYRGLTETDTSALVSCDWALPPAFFTNRNSSSCVRIRTGRNDFLMPKAGSRSSSAASSAVPRSSVCRTAAAASSCTFARSVAVGRMPCCASTRRNTCSWMRTCRTWDRGAGIWLPWAFASSATFLSTPPGAR